MRRLIAWSAGLAASFLSVCALAAEPAVRLDLYGDPLPRGAISRLGTSKVRLPPDEPAAKFTCDDFGLFSHDSKLFASRRHVWEVATGKVVYELKEDGRVLFDPNSEPYVITFAKGRLRARPLKPVPPGWDVVTKSPAISPGTEHVVFQVSTRAGDPFGKPSTNLRYIFTGIDAHRLPDELVAGAGTSPEAWRFGASRDGRQFSIVTRSSNVELHTRGEASQRTKGEGVAGLSGTRPTTTLISPDGKHMAIVPGGEGGQIQVLTARGLEPAAAVRDMAPRASGGLGAAFLGDATQLAVLRSGGEGPAVPVLKVWNGTTEGMIARKTVRDDKHLRDMALWLAARGLRGQVPADFIPLDGDLYYSSALQCRLASTLHNCTAAVSPSGELVALADDICISIWETATHQCVQRMQPGEFVVRLAFSPDDRLLLAHYERNTALVFEAVQPSDELHDRATKDLWADLSLEKARAARKAMLELARRGDDVLPLLDDAFLPARSSDEIRRWIADLGAADVAERDVVERDAAQARLYALGPVALPHLRMAVRGVPNDQQIVRIRALLEHPAETVVNPDILRGIRAIEVASLIGSEPAIERLKRVAEGKYDPRLASRASETYRRLRPGPLAPMP